MIVVFFLVSFLSSVAGSICGIGGGVIIKPVLDALGVMSVTIISFLSGCTVLAMSLVSVYKNLKNKTARLEVKTATALAVGAAIGGAAGKSMFRALKGAVGNENLVGLAQALVLILLTLGTLLYMICKKRIQTMRCRQIWLCVVIGLILGILSSFLGIGGGPMNLAVLSYFFSMSSKEAALSSLYIIMFSQITSLAGTIATGTIPEVPLFYPAIMAAGGILGGMAGSRINRKIDEERVNRLFLVLMVVIIAINVYNGAKFGLGLS